MHYRILAIIFLILSAGAAEADAEDSRYRVEVLVLAHIEHDETPLETATLHNFSDALDFLTPPPDPVETPADGGDEQESAAPEPAASDPQAGVPEELADEDSAEEPACTVIHLTEMGPEMQEAWRRLRLSRPFRPLQYLAWEQPGTPPFPALRVHDLESVLTEDPWQEYRAVPGDELASIEAEGQQQGQQQQQQSAPGEPGSELTDTGSGPLPSPIEFFRLDGRTRLVRTRFLHLEVLVELREPVFDPAVAQLQPVAAESPAGPQDAAPQPTSFLVHRLDQRRQVKTGRMEYFDGPVLGVLAFITDISDTVDEEPPASP